MRRSRLSLHLRLISGHLALTRTQGGSWESGVGGGEGEVGVAAESCFLSSAKILRDFLLVHKDQLRNKLHKVCDTDGPSRTHRSLTLPLSFSLITTAPS